VSTRGDASPRAAAPPADLDPVELARALVRAPSPNPPGDERAVAGVLEEHATALGLGPVRRLAADARRPNLLATLDFGPGGRHLVLSGHLDTKPVGDARWTVAPLAADVDGDRLYGLGAADMKSALAAMVVAAARLAADPPPAGRLSLLFTADEEDGARYGARHVAATVPLEADAVVIGEPGGLHADFDRLHLVSRGIARLRLVARAVQGHSSLADALGARSAGVDAARAVLAVEDDLALDVPPNAAELEGWTATVNTGLAFRGGVGYGVLPGRMAVDTEVRLLPGMARDAVAAAFERTLAGIAERTGAELELAFDAAPNDWLPATLVAPEHPIAAAAREACRAVLGQAPPPSVFPGTTDATFFAELQGIPTLPALGPGLLRRAHAADEWVSIAAVRQAAELYATLARDYCAGSGAEDGSRA
jgi:acetylornithine deacetylase/succinyl-diaminopimelate desuccinylase-like protein